MGSSESTAEQNQSRQRPSLTDIATWWLFWLIFDWDWDAIKKKAALAVGTIWILDTLFFTGLIGNIILAGFLGIIALIALIPYAPTALGIADKFDLINLSPEQSMICRFFSLLFTDIHEYAELLLEYLFGE